MDVTQHSACLASVRSRVQSSLQKKTQKDGSRHVVSQKVSKSELEQTHNAHYLKVGMVVPPRLANSRVEIDAI